MGFFKSVAKVVSAPVTAVRKAVASPVKEAVTDFSESKLGNLMVPGIGFISGEGRSLLGRAAPTAGAIGGGILGSFFGQPGLGAGFGSALGQLGSSSGREGFLDGGLQNAIMAGLAGQGIGSMLPNLMAPGGLLGGGTMGPPAPGGGGLLGGLFGGGGQGGGLLGSLFGGGGAGGGNPLGGLLGGGAGGIGGINPLAALLGGGAAAYGIHQDTKNQERINSLINPLLGGLSGLTALNAPFGPGYETIRGQAMRGLSGDIAGRGFDPSTANPVAAYQKAQLSAELAAREIERATGAQSDLFAKQANIIQGLPAADYSGLTSGGTQLLLRGLGIA